MQEFYHVRCILGDLGISTAEGLACAMFTVVQLVDATALHLVHQASRSCQITKVRAQDVSCKQSSTLGSSSRALAGCRKLHMCWVVGCLGVADPLSMGAHPADARAYVHRSNVSLEPVRYVRWNVEWIHSCSVVV